MVCFVKGSFKLSPIYNLAQDRTLGVIINIHAISFTKSEWRRHSMHYGCIHSINNLQDYK